MSSRLVYKPQWYQKAFHRSSAFFRSAFGGRHSGKSLAGVNEDIRAAVYGIEGIPTPNVGIALSPTNEMLHGDLIPIFEDYLDYKYVKKFTSHRILFTNGSVIHLRSGFKPDAVRGLHPHWAHVDEAAYLESGELLENIMLGLQEGGRIWISTTPRGFNWAYYQCYLPAKEELERGMQDPDYMSWIWRSDMNQYRNKEMLAKIAAGIKDEARRKQELEAEFISYEGQIYKEDEALIVAATPTYVDHICIGFDWGYTHPSAFEVLGSRDGIVYQIDEVMLHNATPMVVAETATALSEKYGYPRIFADPSAPGIIAEMQQVNPKLRVEKAMNDVGVGIGKVDDGLRTGTLKITHGARFLEEKKGYHWVKDKPFKENDDAADALRYAYCGIEVPDNSRIIIVDSRNESVADRYVSKFWRGHDDISIQHDYGEW